MRMDGGMGGKNGRVINAWRVEKTDGSGENGHRGEKMDRGVRNIPMKSKSAELYAEKAGPPTIRLFNFLALYE